ncbi:MAG: proteasome subunit alpha, partial [Acidimicrobiales bacterium]
PGDDQLFHILYDGSIVDEERSTVLGGEADTIAARLQGSSRDDWDLAGAFAGATAALAGPDRSFAPRDLEVAVLERSNGRRAFRRVLGAELEQLVEGAAAEGAVAPDAPAERSEDAEQG